MNRKNTNFGLVFKEVDGCIICQSTKKIDVPGISWLGIGFSYNICNNCGLKFMNPRPTQKSYINFYKNYFWQQKMKASGYETVTGYNNNNNNQKEIRKNKYIAKYKRFIDIVNKELKLSSSTDVLEVGCAFGQKLDWLKRDYQCNVYGIEPNEDAVKEIKDKIDIVGRSAEEYFSNPSNQKLFDLIIFDHSLENIVEPSIVLFDVKARLKVKGKLLIFTPNGEYFDSMNPYHPYIYTPNSIRNLLQSVGFNILNLRASPSPDNKRIILKFGKSNYEMAIVSAVGEISDDIILQNGVRVIEKIKLGNELKVVNTLSFREIVVLLAFRSYRNLLKLITL